MASSRCFRASYLSGCRSLATPTLLHRCDAASTARYSDAWRGPKHQFSERCYSYLTLNRTPASKSQRAMTTLTKEQQSLLWENVKKPEVQLQIQDLIQFGRNADRNTLLASAVFLHKDLPNRLAKRIKDLQSLPVPMYSTRSIRQLAELYEESFVRIIEHPIPKSKATEESFSTMLKDIKEKHRMVQANIANGFMEMTRIGVPKTFVQHEDVQHTLTRFYTGRIGIRLLIEQHIALRQDTEQAAARAAEGKTNPTSAGAGAGNIPSPGTANNVPNTNQNAFVGCIMTDCCVYEVLMDAVEDARAACRMHLKDAPTVVVDGDRKLRVQYIPEHLYIILFELLKNSMRATVELHGRQTNSHEPMYGDDLPATRATIAGGSDTFIRLSDRGGGIPQESVRKIWNFGHSSAPQGMGELAGYGHGLPLSRLYARYWGGDIQVVSLENWGVDCHVRLGVAANGYTPAEADWSKRDRAAPGERREGNIYA